jgi:curli production assembly/transport component CsgG
MTGGAGAVYLGIGGTVQYRRDLVTVYLRAVSVQNGEVLLSVTSSKTVYSASLDANFLKYLTVDNLFQSEGGLTLNEPTQLGVRQAVETAVYSLIMEGAINHLWSFRDQAAGRQAIEEYLKRRDGTPKLTSADESPATTQTPPPALSKTNTGQH